VSPHLRIILDPVSTWTTTEGYLDLSVAAMILRFHQVSSLMRPVHNMPAA